MSMNLLMPLPAVAQLIIAPTAVFVDNANKFASVLIVNRSNEARDVTLDFKFGYPQSDSAGNVTINYADSAIARTYSLVPWIKVFPRQFSLQPGEQRTIRLTVKTPAELQQGAYWARMVTTSTPKAQLVDTNNTNVGAQINVVFNQVIPVVYHNGNLETIVHVEKSRVIADTGGIDLISTIRCQGHSPYFGTTQLRVIDASGNLVEEQKAPCSVYFALDKRFTLTRTLYKPGSYRAEISVSSQRGDIEEKFLRPMQPVQTQISFSVPAIKGAASSAKAK